METGFTGNEQILLYTKDADKAVKIKALGSIYHIKVNELTLDQLNCSVMSVAAGNPQLSNKTGKAAVPVFYSQPELMIFCGMSKAGLDVFLDAYKMAKIEPIALKAMMTPFNSLWSVYELTQELMREHKKISKI